MTASVVTTASAAAMQTRSTKPISSTTRSTTSGSPPFLLAGKQNPHSRPIARGDDSFDDTQGVRGGGLRCQATCSRRLVRGCGGGRRLFTGIVHDLTGRRELERQILKAAANEQRRIGQDLHDSLCQDLVGIAFALDHAQRALPDEAAVAKSLRELLQ
jgi:hypothetical protein